MEYGDFNRVIKFSIDASNLKRSKILFIILLASNNRIPTPRPNPPPPAIKRIRHRHQQRTQTRQHSQRPLHPQPFIKRNRHLDHPARDHVPNQRHARERAGAERLVAIDNILVATDEDTENAVAEEDRGGERGPGRDFGGGGGPAHPEEGDGDRGGAEHGEPEAELGWEAVVVVVAAACGADAGEVALGPDVDHGDEQGGETETDADAEEGEAG